MSQRFDVAVVGGGPAGAVAALLLARRDRRVVLIEASRLEEWRLGETVFPSVREPLSALGLAARFDAIPAVPSDGIRSSWGRADPRARSFIASPYESGWHLDRTAFDRMLVDAARDAGATVRFGTRVTDCEFDADGHGVTLSLESPSESPLPPVHADGLLEATGRAAAMGRQLGAQRDVRDRLVAAGARFRADGFGRYALIESVPEGWWYSAPLPDGRAVAMWFTDADLLDERRRQGPWRDAAAETTETGNRLAGAYFERGPTVAAAVSQRLRPAVGSDRWLAVGDAAMSVDPLSGRGIERAIDTGVRGALAMDRWLDGDRAAALTYERDLAEAFETYLERRRRYYALEDRWPGKAFWRRRHETAPATP